jgi:hypothetical protein
MSKPVTRQKKTRTWRSGRPIVAWGGGTASIAPRDVGAQKAFTAAMQARKAIQNRIVCAFRRHIEGSGSGPGDAELLMFARLAVAEQRLGSSLARAKAAQTLPGPASVLHRGEQQ